MRKKIFMNYYVYLIRNKINNKIYIGKRKCPIKKTPITDSYFGSGIVLKRAIEKYGKENFEKEILAEEINVDLINELEKQFISKFESTKREKGYNRTAGGDGGHTTRFFTKEEMDVYRNNCKNRPPISDETRQKISENVNIPVVKKNLEKARIGFNKLISSGWRQNFSNETRKKMSEKAKLSHNKKILCIETNTIYNSMTEAAEKTGSLISKISQCCHGKRNKTNKLSWKFV